MAGGGNKTHYLRRNEQNRQSRRHVFFDTEARISYQQPIQRQEWLLGCARFLDADTRRREPKLTDAEYFDNRELWQDVSDFTRPNTRTLVWAHNLAYDLRISNALEILPDLGWTLRAIVLDGISSWAKFSDDDKRTLVCTDFTSWASVPLAHIASLLGMETAPLPEIPEQDIPGTLARCRQDVRVLHAAVTHTLDWLREEELGNLQITGAGQAWSAYRHRFMSEKLLVHGDPAVRGTERRAIWAGRTEAWRHGTYSNDHLHEFDLQRAYATVARDCDMPTVYVGRLGNDTEDDGPGTASERGKLTADNVLLWSGRKRRILADVTVTTSEPLVPTLHEDRILWPIGQFRSQLWDSEIALLAERGQDVRIHSALVYTATPCLHDWATWILGELSPDGTSSPLQQRILKQWSRSLIGRFALQYRQWEEVGTAEESDLYLAFQTGEDATPGSQILQAGRSILELGGMVDGENCLPQITGYITSVCRVRLWNLMQEAGLENLFYVDTDSLIVNSRGARNLSARIERDGAYGLVHKSAISRIEIQGPRQISIDGERRYSGVPRNAVASGDDEVAGEVWEGIGEALRNGRSDQVLVYERAFKLIGSDTRRNWLDNGRTEAVRIGENL